MILLLEELFSGTSLLLAFIILINPQKVNIRANCWFGTFIFSIFLISIEILTPKINETVQNFVALSNFAVAPLFYFSVSYFISPNRKWKVKDYLHFLFFFLIAFLTIISSFIDNGTSNDELNPEVVTQINLIFSLIFSLQVVIYCLLSLKKILRHQNNVRLFSSSIEYIDLKWLEFICYGIVTMAFFWTTDIIFTLSEKSASFNYLSSSINLFVVFFITYNWLKQKEIYPYNDNAQKEIEQIITGETIAEENRKKVVSDEKLAEIKIELLQLMETQKPYLDSELNLIKLATEMNVSSHVLSYSLNKGFNENFYQFVNRYRVEEAKKLLKDDTKNNFNLVGIAFEVGFNSKTAFNTTFKKITHLTPTEFKKEQLTVNLEIKKRSD